MISVPIYPGGDPASLNVAVTFTGLSNDEATTVLNNLPVDSTAAVVVRKPAIGGKRFEIAAEGLSVQGAKDLTTAAFLHVEWVASGGAPDLDRTNDRPNVAHPLSLGEQPHDPDGCHERGRPHLGPCVSEPSAVCLLAGDGEHDCDDPTSEATCRYEQTVTAPNPAGAPS